MKKNAVITGGSKGIGKALVLKFIAEGFNVYTCSRSISDQDFLEIDQNPALKWMKADLSQKSEVVKFAEFVLNNTNSIDVLINNTGVFIPGQIQSEDENVLETMMNTNLYSAYHLTRALLPSMMAQKSGHLFVMCSTASIMPYVNGGSYCISKYALYGMTKVLREELKTTGIKVTAVLPGATYTSSWDGVDLPEERFMKSEDVAETIFAAYSLSDRAVMEEVLLRPQLGDL